MSETKVRVFHLYDDEVCVPFTYSEEHGVYLGEYPDFDKSPRHTPGGRPWVNAMNEGCTYAEAEYGDCGSCRYLRTEKPGDLIGVCDHDDKRVHLRE